MSELNTPYAPGTPAWVDMMTTDRGATTEFYGGLFGWDFEVGGPETGYYTNALVRGLPVAGFGEMPRDAMFPVVWTTYLATDDLDESLEALGAAGGKVLVPEFDTGGPGRGAIAIDPTGAAFGLWEAGTHIGAYVVNEPGAVVWNELATRDPFRAAEFYRDVFGLGLDPLPDFPYTQLTADGRAVAGVFGMAGGIPAEIPPHWMTYFAVSDAEVSARRVRELGGVTVGDVVDSPFGRFTTAGDPLGATFRLIQPPPSTRG
ncbi:VOC family protein [Saccharothrix longispora]|uniref:Enzyme related to lactoylglutathione lyase n=1 Tax=Saccharothrix longispora TaxID=33920 RepID=A0ABU1Q728_9PSEU|nr:VOC family protein [Saccharothrix longispora]MDR6598683.1 putative enzyme related to lactoylglutathione lyase [Saccharothrix longispora]